MKMFAQYRFAPKPLFWASSAGLIVALLAIGSAAIESPSAGGRSLESTVLLYGLAICLACYALGTITENLRRFSSGAPLLPPTPFGFETEKPRSLSQFVVILFQGAAYGLFALLCLYGTFL
ncbi:hypothetical protein [Roseivivax sp. CAU 1761]